MAQATKHVRLAQSLPDKLLKLFTRWPPAQISAVAPPSSKLLETIEIAENTSSADPNATSTATSEVSTEPPSNYANNQTTKNNPFLPWKNPRTGNWHGPHYSSRRQGDLYRLARRYNVLSLMPQSPKHPDIKDQKRVEHGLRLQGTGVGKKVKGKLWERTLRSRLEERRKAMEGMPEMIRHWKQRGHGRGWKKWPK